MKNRKFLLVLLLIVTTLAIALTAACAKPAEPADEATNKPADVATDVPATGAPAVTDVPTEAPTAAPTAEPTEAPTAKPALGENKGKPFADGQEGVVQLYFENFDDEDLTLDDLMEDAGSLWGPSHMELIDGKLCLAFAGGVPENNHQSYFALYDEDFDTFEQFELSFDYKIAYTVPSNKSAAWMANMIGCFVSTPAGRVPTNVSDGIFIGLNNKGEFPIYGIGETGAEGGWPTGAMLFKYGKEDVFDEERHVQMVQTNDMKAYLYIDGELICHFEIGETEVTLFDAAGNAVGSKANDPSNQAGANMMIWTHCTGAIVDNFCMKAY